MLTSIARRGSLDSIARCLGISRQPSSRHNLQNRLKTPPEGPDRAHEI
jgi:hypothetical protein